MPYRFDRRSLLAAAAVTPIAGAPFTAHAEEGSPEASPSATIGLPDSLVGRQFAWLLAVVNGDQPMPDEPGIEEHFAPSFLEAVPVDSLIMTLEQLATMFAPITVMEVIEPQSEHLLNVVVLASDQSMLTITLHVEETEPHRIDGLLFAPYEQGGAELPTFADWGEFESALSSETGNVAISASRLTAGELEPIHQSNPEDVLAIGSVFKLYVLAAVVDAIEDGELAWNSEIELTEQAISFPSGITQDDPIGSKIDVETLATRMISISDNTATDLLMHAVGRDRVEAALETLGNSVPERNLPFLTTREMFLIKLGDKSRRDDFAASDETARRAMLDELADESLPPLAEVVAWEIPLEIDTIEWFATMPDLERAHLWLREARQRPGLEPLDTVMTTNPGVPFDPEVWRSVSFKGGSEPGVMSLSWLLERADGEAFTFAVTINDQSQGLDETAIALAAGGAFSLLAE